MKNEYLPIGTVVLLKGGSKNVMINGYFCAPLDNKEKVFDYRGCPFPEGIIDSRGVALFNASDIQKVIHMGYKNDESIDFLDRIEIIKEKSEKKVNC